MQRAPTNLATGKYRFKNIKLMIHRCSKGFGERSENSSAVQTNLGWDTVQAYRQIQTLLRNVLPPSTEMKCVG
jgi:hypothetical protein